MSQYKISDLAAVDLEEIWLYVAQDKPGAADSLVEKILGKFETLAESPKIGLLREELARSLRSFPVGNYIIFYRPSEKGIEIVRVLSGYRDIPELFQ